MKKYDDGDDDGDNDGKKYRNDNNNATSGSGSDDPIFDTIMTPWECLVLADEDL